MQRSRERQKPANMSARQQANELVELIRKLRWMGLEEEAERVEMELARCGLADSVLAASRETD